MDINVIKTNKHMTRYKRYAFISYSHKDVKEAEWLHKHLEYYKLPSDIFNEYDENKNFEQRFSQYEDYPSNMDLNSVQETLIETICEKLCEDIFNKAVVNW